MPELPDLEVFKGNLKKQLLNTSLLAIDVISPKNVFPNSGPVLAQFTNQKLIDIQRIGKELIFCFPEKRRIAVHLMLNGMFHLCSSKKQITTIEGRVAVFHFNQRILVIDDPGGLCKIQFMPKINKVPDALSPEFTLAYLTERLERSPLLNIKSFLIDQKIIKGIGNAYADEILWESRISPQSLCGNLTPEATMLLYSSIQNILNEAIVNISKEAPEIISGEIRDFLKVHNPHRKYSPTGKLIQVKKIASKTTYFTEEQTLY